MKRHLNRWVSLLVPLIAVTAMAGSGYAVWRFGNANGELTKKESGNVKVEAKMSFAYERVYVWFGNEEFGKAFPSPSTSDPKVNVHSTQILANQSEVTADAPLNVVAFFNTDIDTEEISNRLDIYYDFTIVTSPAFDELFSLTVAQDVTLASTGDYAGEVDFDHTQVISENGSSLTYLVFKKLSFALDYLPGREPLAPEAVKSYIDKMNGTSDPWLTFNLTLSAKAKDANA